MLFDLRAAARPTTANVVAGIRDHRALAHVAIVATALLATLLLSLQGAAAGPTPAKSEPASILPQNVGVGVPTTDPVVIRFAAPMDRSSVADALELRPSTAWRASWSEDGRSLRLDPEHRWQTDARYVVKVGEAARRADGRPIDAAMQLSFTTETAPVISDFQLRYPEETTADRLRAAAAAEVDAVAALPAPEELPPSTAGGVSAGTRIRIGFSTVMDRADVEDRFAIHPAVDGMLSWEGNTLVFEPSGRLEDGQRYAVSVIGARDERGNRLDGDASFSFTTRPGAQIVKVTPKPGARDVTPSTLQLWFSQPMETSSTEAALRLHDATADADVDGSFAWNPDATQLTFTPDDDLAEGHSFVIVLEGAQDLDRNTVDGKWGFRTEAPPPPPAPAAPAPAAPTQPAPPPAGPPAPADIVQFAVWQINQSRAAYGFAPLQLDGAISQVATDYAWDLMNYGYFSHTGRDGSRVSDRLRRAGIAFSASGENLCYLSGGGLRGTLEWCHSVFMAEPYPGYANHIGNILSPRFTRVGIGIAQSGSRIKIVWDFAG